MTTICQCCFFLSFFFYSSSILWHDIHWFFVQFFFSFIHLYDVLWQWGEKKFRNLIKLFSSESAGDYYQSDDDVVVDAESVFLCMRPNNMMLFILIKTNTNKSDGQCIRNEMKTFSRFKNCQKKINLIEKKTSSSLKD